MDKLSKRDRWSEFIGQWRTSGQSKAGFCRTHELSECQFHYWYHRLGEDESTDIPAGFARVTVGRGTSGVRLRIVDGVEVELDANFDCRTLKRLLSTLKSPC